MRFAPATAILILALAASARAADSAADSGLLQPYFGNTFISLHDDGTQFIVYWNADGTFTLTRRGGPEPSAGYTMSGAYTIENGRSCFHPKEAVPGAPECVPVERGKTPGTVWNTRGRIHELHMIVVGR